MNTLCNQTVVAGVKLHDAFISGREAGRMLFPPSLNPHPVLSADNLSWEQGRVSAQAEFFNRLNLPICKAAA